MMPHQQKKMLWIGTFLISMLTFFYLICVHYTDINQIAISRNRVSGIVQIDTVSGWNITAPWVTVARIDARPVRVCITSSGRSFNCKLVRFIPSGYKEFVAIEGFHYYWLANRISFNGGYNEEYRGMNDLLRGYAFTGRDYPFITILKEY